MAKDDITLGFELGRLEIEPTKITKTVKEENPFIPHLSLLQRKKINVRNGHLIPKCSCNLQKTNKNHLISKKKCRRILKEPVLKLLNVNDPSSTSYKDYKSCISKPDNLSLFALVDNCNQLRITSENNQTSSDLNEKTGGDNQWWKCGSSNGRNSEFQLVNSQTGSCSQQALNPPCDVTIDELASYFETMVHIPKKMSSMAEMMYI